MTSWIPNHDRVASGLAFQPEPWDLSHELWYWKGPKEMIDIPLPKDTSLLHKWGGANKSNLHCWEVSPRIAHDNLRVFGYVAHNRLKDSPPLSFNNEGL